MLEFISNVPDYIIGGVYLLGLSLGLFIYGWVKNGSLRKWLKEFI